VRTAWEEVSGTGISAQGSHLHQQLEKVQTSQREALAQKAALSERAFAELSSEAEERAAHAAALGRELERSRADSAAVTEERDALQSKLVALQNDHSALAAQASFSNHRKP
jgi:predicted  nucleic acid-binding Zn-ribbon protein